MFQSLLYSIILFFIIIIIYLIYKFIKILNNFNKFCYEFNIFQENNIGDYICGYEKILVIIYLIIIISIIIINFLLIYFLYNPLI